MKNKAEVIKPIIYTVMYYLTRWIGFRPKVMTLEQTVDYIVNKNCSVSRFGDGELRWMYGLKQDSFQKQDSRLKNKLIKTIKMDTDNLLICVPDIFGDLNVYTPPARKFWMTNMGKFRFLWLHLMNKEYLYGNLNFTRFYLDYKDKSKCDMLVYKLKMIWDKRDVVIVEGEMTRFGIGNNLLENAKSIERVLCPSKNAFAVYDNIIEYIENNITKDKLILAALGPTATILAADISDKGYQIIDIGHLDIEYEWYLSNATEKTQVVGKYVNEAGGCSKDFMDEKVVASYLKQIVGRIGIS
jgi:glycosyltransferase family protein